MVAHAPDTVAVSAADARVAGRYAAQSYLWDRSVRPRGRSCGLRSTGGSVELRRTTCPGDVVGGFSGLQTCGSVWACPVCSAKVLAERQSEVAAAVTAWMLLGGRIAFMTFTVRHHRGHSLALVWDAVQAAHHRMTSGRAHQGEKARHGVATTRVVASGARKGQSVATNVLPWLRVVEVTEGTGGRENGWHVHQHMLVFLPGSTTQDTLDDLYAAMHARWALGAAEVGLSGALMVNHAKFVDSAAGIGSYVTKNTYTPAEVAALEVTRGDLKAGRLGNRSAMQILRDLVESDRPADRALWAEFEHASSGRRQMTWATGARDLLGLGDERDDETIAADEVGTRDDAVCLFDPADYRRSIALVPGRRVQLLAAVKVSGSVALDLLDAWGVAYTLPTFDERTAVVLNPFGHHTAAEARSIAATRIRDSIAPTVLGRASSRPPADVDAFVAACAAAGARSRT